MMNNSEKVASKPIVKGQYVMIVYDKPFADKYPHTTKIFNRQNGVVIKLVGSHDLFEVRLPTMGVNTLVDRRHLF